MNFLLRSCDMRVEAVCPRDTGTLLFSSLSLFHFSLSLSLSLFSSIFFSSSSALRASWLPAQRITESRSLCLFRPEFRNVPRATRVSLARFTPLRAKTPRIHRIRQPWSPTELFFAISRIISGLLDYSEDTTIEFFAARISQIRHPRNKQK